MSSTNKTTNYQLSQFVGNDIPSWLNDYNGDMRKIDTAIKEVAVAGGDNASAISEIESTVGRHTTEISGINSTVNSLSGRVLGIEDKIPDTASAQNKLITAQELPEIPSIEGLENDVAQLKSDVTEIQSEVNGINGDVNAIKLCVPSNASASNKFATMSDIPTNIGGYRKIAESNDNTRTFAQHLTYLSDLLTSEGYANNQFINTNVALLIRRGSDSTGKDDAFCIFNGKDFVCENTTSLQGIDVISLNRAGTAFEYIMEIPHSSSSSSKADINGYYHNIASETGSTMYAFVL